MVLPQVGQDRWSVFYAQEGVVDTFEVYIRGAVMHTTLYAAFRHEFIAVSGESRPDLPPTEAAHDLFARITAELNTYGLSLDDTVRTRLWGRDRAARDDGSRTRVQVLSGRARSASSSYISPYHFASAGTVAVDLWAMRGGTQKTIQEYDPPIVPPRYVTAGGLVFLSGVTWDTGTLDEQLATILSRIGGSLQDAGASWAHVVQLSCFLHRSQTVLALQAGLLKILGTELGTRLSVETPAAVEYRFVDGYSTPGKLIENEASPQQAAGYHKEGHCL